LKIQRYNDAALICWKFFCCSRIVAAARAIGRKDSGDKKLGK